MKNNFNKNNNIQNEEQDQLSKKNFEMKKNFKGERCLLSLLISTDYAHPFLSGRKNCYCWSFEGYLKLVDLSNIYLVKAQLMLVTGPLKSIPVLLMNPPDKRKQILYSPAMAFKVIQIIQIKNTPDKINKH